LTQTQLAIMVGLQRPNISRLETGAHVPSILLLERFAEARQIKISDLISE
jgi:transcriptional regulator with XRE-family HTH domain